MTKHTVTVTCDRCEGKGEICDYEVGSGGQHMWPCGTCLGKGHVEHEVMGLTQDQAFIYVCAVRYAINRQTYAGGIVIQELQKVIPKLPYSDRKLLEKEIADALFKHEVDPVFRPQWEEIVDQLRAVP